MVRTRHAKICIEGSVTSVTGVTDDEGKPETRVAREFLAFVPRRRRKKKNGERGEDDTRERAEKKGERISEISGDEVSGLTSYAGMTCHARRERFVSKLQHFLSLKYI